MQTFFLGSIAMTNGARYALSQASIHPLELIERRRRGQVLSFDSPLGSRSSTPFSRQKRSSRPDPDSP